MCTQLKSVAGSSVENEDPVTQKPESQQKVAGEMEVDDNDSDYIYEGDEDDDDYVQDDDDDIDEDGDEEQETEEVVIEKLDSKEKGKTVEITDKGTIIRDQKSLEMQTTRNQKDSSVYRRNSCGTIPRNRELDMLGKQSKQMRNSCPIIKNSTDVIKRIKNQISDEEMSINGNSCEKSGIQVPHKPINISVVDGMFRIIVNGFEVERHSTGTDSNPTFVCCLCLEKTGSTDLVLHCKLHKFLKVTDSCKLCSSKMKVEELKNHLNIHQLFLEPVICKDLNQFRAGTTTNESFHETAKGSIVGKIPVFKCSKCEKLFPAEDDLRKHAENNKCVEPDKSLEKVDTSNQSGRQVPISFRPVEVFKKQDNSYRVAIRGFLLCLNENEGSETFKCCLCLQIMNVTNIVSHIKSHNPLKTSDECNVCFTKCNSINELKKHLNSHSYFLSGVICQDLNEFETKIYVQSKICVPPCNESVDDPIVNSEELECKMPIFTCKYCPKLLLDHEDLESHKKVHDTNEMLSEELIPSNCKPAYEILQEIDGIDVTVVVSGFIMGSERNDTIQSSLGNNKETAKHTCCICLQAVNTINIASHCDSHYPLKATDNCQVCSLHFEDTSALEEHLIEHKIALEVLICMNLEEFNRKVAELCENDMGENNNLIPGFQCNLCRMIFLDERKLSSHMESVTCVSYVQPIEFLKESETGMDLAIYGYSSHSRSEGEGEPSSYICCICLEELESKDFILLHYKLHYPLKATDTCKLCNLSHDSVDLLELHLSKHRVLLNVMDLAVSTGSHSACQQIQETSNFLDACNLQIAITEDIVKCLVCETPFADECTFKKHLQSGKCIKFKTFACRECGRNYSTQRLLNEHMKTHSGTYSLCHICGANIKTRGMRRHVRTVHERWEATQLQNSANKKVCQVCGVTVSKYVFNQHLATHFFNRNYKCGSCDKTFSHKISLKIHLKTHESAQKTYTCEICSDTFRRRDHVVAHKARIHNIIRVKNYKCDVCQKSFSTSNTLHVHKRTHLESQNYQCLECKVIFSSGMGLKNHQSQTRHEGVKIISSALDEHVKVNRFVCKICGQRYGSLASLRGHENIHKDSNTTDQSPSTYECPECHRNYSSQRSLELHIIMTNHAVDRKQWKRRAQAQQPQAEKKPTERKFACNMCDSKFIKLFHLKKHRLRLKHFLVCSLCNDATVTDLDRHNKEKHPPSESNITYNCTECPKKFKKLKMLDNHISLKHTNQTDVPAATETSSQSSPFSSIIVVKAIKKIPMPDA
ncbi:zinc finger protein 845 isoform X3 [Nilaparvata lugens]|uniref:zinc finger protein 845 isoform X3 n=1 Tax=Nilaparvata lugens TaxID=108931 RepID=UPI00193D18A7|nr:zinc finger protein 845 isoform X3 [Nilaparvata lugens]